MDVRGLSEGVLDAKVMRNKANMLESVKLANDVTYKRYDCAYTEGKQTII